MEKRKISGIKTDFKPYRGKNSIGKFVINERSFGKKRVKSGKNGKNSGQFEGSKETFNGFYVQTDRASRPCTYMIMPTSN